MKTQKYANKVIYNKSLKWAEEFVKRLENSKPLTNISLIPPSGQTKWTDISVNNSGRVKEKLWFYYVQY